MKQIILVIALLIPVFCIAQRHNIKEGGEQIKIEFDSKYLIDMDTTESGVIEIKLTPITEAAKELESLLGSILSEKEALQIEIDEKQQKVKLLAEQVKEVNQLINKINKNKERSPRAVGTPESNPPGRDETITVKKRRKN